MSSGVHSGSHVAMVPRRCPGVPTPQLPTRWQTVQTESESLRSSERLLSRPQCSPCGFITRGLLSVPEYFD